MKMAVTNARLPAWLQPNAWPAAQLSTLIIENGTVQTLLQAGTPLPASGFGKIHDLHGKLVLPALVEAHAHLDKAYTRSRLGRLAPGLLPAIRATQADQAYWTDEDISARAHKALDAAHRAGVTHLRTHLDWSDVLAPRAWHVLGEVAEDWKERVTVERVALVPLAVFQTVRAAQTVAAQIRHAKRSVFGGFVHTSNYVPQYLDHALDAALEAGLPIDLHIDEELSPVARGLEHVVHRIETHGGELPRIVCSHACALAAKPYADTLELLDRVAKLPVTLVCLPATNLLLQDAQPGMTPLSRGLTRVKEARERDIPVLFGSDNVQDAFCALGNFDPVGALHTATLAAQLDDVLDTWSQSICRVDWLRESTPAPPTLVGKRAEFVVFHTSEKSTWPAESHRFFLNRLEMK